MAAEPLSAEGDILTRAHELSDTDDIAEMITIIIARARSARVDSEPLAGLATAAQKLADETWVGEAMKHDNGRERYVCDVEMFEAISEAYGQLQIESTYATDELEKAQGAKSRARRAHRLAQIVLAAAIARPVKLKCDGCHAVRRAAIAEAQRKIDEALNREALADDAIEILAEVMDDIDDAMACLLMVPDDYEDHYAEPLRLVREDPRALPKDGDFLTAYGARLAPRRIDRRAAAAIGSALAGAQ
jgi:hypothetical protein